MDTIEKLTYKGYRIEIVIDSDPCNPRQDWDNLGKIVCWHRRYALSDKGQNDEFRTPEDFQEFAKRTKCEVLPIYMFDHSGITINTTGFSCPWDSGQVGYIYVTREEGIKEFGRQWRKRARALMISEVKEFDYYLTGQVYGYRIFEDIQNESGDDIDDELESCYGFFGESDYCLQEAKAIVDHMSARQLLPIA